MDDGATDFGVVLAIAHATFQHRLGEHMKSAGFADWAPRHDAVLRVLGEAEMSLRELAGHLQMTSPGALKLVSLLEQGGLVERVSAPADRRVRLVRVTDRGHEALEVARGWHAEFEADLARRIGLDVVRAARTVLEDVAHQAPSEVPSLLWSASATTTPALRR